MHNDKRIIIISAPSGAGKTTIVKYLLNTFSVLDFSVSATTRLPRQGEIDGKDYYFLSRGDFEQKIINDEFIEYEEVYENTIYGTLKSEVRRIWQQNKIPIFDVDVSGGLAIKKIFPMCSLLIFIMPPSIPVLKERILKRSFIPEHELNTRLLKVKQEMKSSCKFDEIIKNDDLNEALARSTRLIKKFIS